MDFPPQAVYQERVPLDEYMLRTSQGVAHREMVLEEMLLLWLANVNPAFSPFRELFDDGELAQETAYPAVDGRGRRVLFTPAACSAPTTRT